MMEIIDISIPVSRDLPVWPGDPTIEIDRIAAIDRGDDANVSKLSCGVHIGTHVDAPLHFIEGGATIPDLDLGILIGPVLVIEFPTISVIDEAVLAGAEIPPFTDRLLFKTRNSEHWRTGEKVFSREFIAVNESGARWLIDRDVKLIGVDYLSVAPFNQPVPTHQVLLEEEVVIVEGLDLHAVEPGDYQLSCLPIKLVGCEGAPARAVLIRDD